MPRLQKPPILVGNTPRVDVPIAGRVVSCGGVRGAEMGMDVVVVALLPAASVTSPVIILMGVTPGRTGGRLPQDTETRCWEVSTTVPSMDRTNGWVPPVMSHSTSVKELAVQTL